MAAGELQFFMHHLESTDQTADNPMPAYQAAIEFGIDTSQLDYLLTLTPAERLRRHDAALAFVMAARNAGIKYYGFDPGSPEAAQ
jgi:hypothetical protein